jgi:hypothetical protein
MRRLQSLYDHTFGQPFRELRSLMVDISIRHSASLIARPRIGGSRCALAPVVLQVHPRSPRVVTTREAYEW